ncbi:hypothetical protein Misp06_02744 [Microbulbifer sp. NBRC 101763]|uniref:DUF6962 family protein n=1 Tax=unclassified Microbulbifer TaxID=2619833 RepID=UPI0030B6BD30
MKLSSLQTELTSAATDIILALIALVALIYLVRYSPKGGRKYLAWKFFFFLTIVVTVLAATIHGLELSVQLSQRLWRVLFFFLGLFLIAFTTAICFDLLGEKATQKVLPYIPLIGIAFYVVTLLWPEGFLAYVIYQFSITFIIIFGYGRLAWLNKLNGSWYMALGGLLSLIAIYIQTKDSLYITLIWDFDHNGIYHMVQSVAVILFFLGIRRALLNNQ